METKGRPGFRQNPGPLNGRDSEEGVGGHRPEDVVGAGGSAPTGLCFPSAIVTSLKLVLLADADLMCLPVTGWETTI